MGSVRVLKSIVAMLVVASAACSSGGPAVSGSGGRPGTGGTTAGSGGMTATGGRASGGDGGDSGSGGTTATGGMTVEGTGGANVTGGAGGSAIGGRPGMETGGTSGGGRSGVAGSGPAGSGGGSAGGAAGTPANGNAPVGTAGCGKTRTLQNGTITIMFNNASRKYILRVPEGYDNSHPYRLVVAYAESGASAQSVATRNYFTLAAMDSKNTIFAAPDAANGAGSWSKSDVELTDTILAQVEGDLCIDKTRVFATGFSFGGAMSIAVACTRADVFRAVAFFSGADLTGSCPATLTKPIAYYASQASLDSSGPPLPTSGRTKQAEFAAINGCTAEPAATTFPAAGQAHTCTIYKGCSAGHPTVYCVFNGPHGWEPKDPGQSMSWDATEAWKFITQF